MQAVVVGGEVAEREEHAERLLHAQNSMEGPLAVELDYWLRRFGGNARVGDDVLAGVVALGRAVPQKEAVEDRWRGSTCQ